MNKAGDALTEEHFRTETGAVRSLYNSPKLEPHHMKKILEGSLRNSLIGVRDLPSVMVKNEHMKSCMGVFTRYQDATDVYASFKKSKPSAEEQQLIEHCRAMEASGVDVSSLPMHEIQRYNLARAVTDLYSLREFMRAVKKAQRQGGYDYNEVQGRKENAKIYASGKAMLKNWQW